MTNGPIEPIAPLREEHLLLQATVLDFARQVLQPMVDEIEAAGEFPRSLWESLGSLGLLGITVPPEYGGAGMDTLANVIAVEQIARISGSVALSYAAHSNLCLANIYENGTEEQRRLYVPGLCSGASIGALALTEPQAGSDAIGIRTTAVRKGDSYVLNGRKMFITNAPLADIFLVYAKTSPEAGSHGLSAFVVERSFPGVQVQKKLDKFGHRGSPTAEVLLDDCVVPVSNLLGREDEGVGILMSGLSTERIVVAGEPLGLAEEALSLSITYARERQQFGQPIGNFQLIQAKLADMYTQIEAARSLLYRTAARADHGLASPKEAAACILFAGEMATKVCLDAMQIHGGYGYMNDLPLGRMLRDAKLLEIGAGTSEIRRLIIGRELLKSGL